VDPATGVRTLKAIDLFEISVVTFPANDLAMVGTVHSLGENEVSALMRALGRATAALGGCSPYCSALQPLMRRQVAAPSS
ncbi:MAG: HK97 family phage prohead protease, partial [Methylobacteriaceae bacterium]|nr:HK97 family phage prohead protease [Methylobacteriaceae bacterium]